MNDKDVEIPIPSSESDYKIGRIILSKDDDEFNEIIKQDNSWDTIVNLSHLPLGLFSWYPFNKNSQVLHINAGFGNITRQLANNYINVTAVEEDLYRNFCLKRRLARYKNVNVIGKLCEIQNQKFDYIIFTYEKGMIEAELINYINKLKEMLNFSGRLLFITSNRIGIKYLCGEPSIFTQITFDDITNSTDNTLRFTRTSIRSFFNNVGFKKVKLYYPFPDYQFPQMIYTDECSPKEEIIERLRNYIVNKSSRVLDENDLIKIFLHESDILNFANSFIVECGQEELTDIMYATLSTERSKENAFSTVIKSNIVEKIPIFKEGEIGLSNLISNMEELKMRKVPVLLPIFKNGKAIMNKILYPTLSEYIRKLVQERKREEIIKCIDNLYEYILLSSDTVNKNMNALKHYAPDEDWGPILEKVYIEMIPVNCFMTDNGMLFFDQEFTRKCYPAKYVLYRAINDIYYFIPSAEMLFSLKEAKKRYGLEKIWVYMVKADEPFHTELRQNKLYNHFYYWIKNDEIAISDNRKVLTTNSEKQYDLYLPFSGLNYKKIVLFGAGKYCDYFLDKYGDRYVPEFIIDNNEQIWGTFKRKIEIKSPSVISNIDYENYRIIITVAKYEEIINQLKELGIPKECYRIYDRVIDSLLPYSLSNTTLDGKYNIGYVTGVFDLFHIGHLNILKQCKNRCHYLIVGVVNDNLVELEKGKCPFIPLKERMEIVRQCKYVDKVVEIDEHNTNKLDAWKELRYGCLFAGSDHEVQDDWLNLQRQLRSLGANLEFFPYTEGTSSTILQKIIKNEVEKQ